MKGYDGLGILTPATSPKNQAQQQQQQSTEMLNGSSNGTSLLSGSVENLSIPLTPVSPAPSPSSSSSSYQQMKKGDA